MEQGGAGTEHQATSTRDRLLGAALEAFGKKGFNGATTKEIAREAGVNEVTLFRYFGSKKALFGAVIEERSPLTQIKRAISIDTAASIDDILIHNLHAVLEALRANKHLYMVLLGDAWRIPETRAMIGDLAIRRGMSAVSEFIKVQMDAGKLRTMDPTVAGRAIMGMIQIYFLMDELLEGKEIDPAEDERIINGFVSVFLDGMRPRGGE